ncbi:hypothetical protein B1813_21665 [Saccharomonospora piscinae]|uniref:DUF5709 domain-containing protein n=1 Tax=Saccharomonospora piscinae TaxID=687388 RepID=A0A1V8ZXA1_SACPI|nr:hypothetical protein [Saccharomonospora piscinae]OQO89539.1 hypothetical protein B1813_21665 [Saccharomonospora piscinae]TLW91232.1 hypothetical protein FFT09_18405 [Saccharomonospora piscinae]
MSDGSEPVTPPQDTGLPDSAETDPAGLSSAEDLDEDRLRVDPLEEGVEPPEHWSEADRYGMTPFEQQQGEPLEERVRQEEPDVAQAEIPERPVAATPATELDDTVDQVTEDVAPVMPEDDPAPPDTPGVRRGQNADQAGGSVADALRTPGGDDADSGRP